MDGFGVERGQKAEVVHLSLAVIESRSRRGPIGYVRLWEPRFQLARLLRVDVRPRTVRGRSRRHQARHSLVDRAGDRVRDQAADGIISTGRPAGTDAEKGRSLCKRDTGA